MSTIVNLTPHKVTVMASEGYVVAEYPASGQVARVTMSDTYVGSVNGISVVTKTAGEVVGLPEPAEDTYYIVSGLVQAAFPHRTDLLVPDDLVRDVEGRVVGCRRFSVNAG